MAALFFVPYKAFSTITTDDIYCFGASDNSVAAGTTPTLIAVKGADTAQSLPLTALWRKVQFQ